MTDFIMPTDAELAVLVETMDIDAFNNLLAQREAAVNEIVQNKNLAADKRDELRRQVIELETTMRKSAQMLGEHGRAGKKIERYRISCLVRIKQAQRV